MPPRRQSNGTGRGVGATTRASVTRGSNMASSTASGNSGPLLPTSVNVQPSMSVASDAATSSSTNKGAKASSVTEHETANSSPSASMSKRQAAPPPVKRQRSEGPNWKEFYKNGLPAEVIVIDDTPEPEAHVTQAATPVATIHEAPAANSARKRKRASDNAPPVVNDNVRGTRSRVAAYASGALPVPSPTTTPAVEASTAEGPAQKRTKRIRRSAPEEAQIDPVETSFLVPYQKPALPVKRSGEIMVRAVREVSRLVVLRIAC